MNEGDGFVLGDTHRTQHKIIDKLPTKITNANLRMSSMVVYATLYMYNATDLPVALTRMHLRSSRLHKTRSSLLVPYPTTMHACMRVYVCVCV